MSKVIRLISCLSLLCLCLGCSFQDTDDQEIDNELNKEISKVMELYLEASADPTKVEAFNNHIEDLDNEYGCNLRETLIPGSSAARLVTGGGNYPPLTDLPVYRDGDIYLSGGVTGAISAIVNWVCPTSTAGQYQHAAILDLDKFDPSNPDALCFQTALPEGAAYESHRDWQEKPNVAVMKPRYAINTNALNARQQVMDLYCSGVNTTSYGFFKDMANIFSIVSKSDNYYWYCTKVPWRVYSEIGYYDIDSNSNAINWKSSGLYDFVKAYYKARYLFNSSKAKSKLESYMADTKETIVLAEEIYLSPYLTKYYEKIRY